MPGGQPQGSLQRLDLHFKGNFLFLLLPPPDILHPLHLLPLHQAAPLPLLLNHPVTFLHELLPQGPVLDYLPFQTLLEVGQLTLICLF